jgi:hypothetical protein
MFMLRCGGIDRFVELSRNGNLVALCEPSLHVDRGRSVWRVDGQPTRDRSWLIAYNLRPLVGADRQVREEPPGSCS